jgi:polar amino acid transport system substrate-binding protein
MSKIIVIACISAALLLGGFLDRRTSYAAGVIPQPLTPYKPPAGAPTSSEPAKDSPASSTETSTPPSTEPSRKLLVGTRVIPPFIIKNADGTYSGISMDLWKEIAGRLKLDYQVREFEIKDLIAAGKAGTVDAIVSVTISAEREKEFDLTHAFYSTGLAIAVIPKADGGIISTIKQIMTAKFAKLIALLFLVLSIIGALMWLVERRRNEQFGGTARHGLGVGLWWSAVTMTTVGYGDKAPVTFLGRVLGLVWMFAAILIISSFTASISSVLTVSQLESSINGPKDLAGKRVGTLETTAAAKYCQTHSIGYKACKDVPAAVEALSKGELDAVVYEAPVLQYVVKNQSNSAITVLPGTFDNHGYGFGLRTGSPLREQFNQEMLTFTASDAWPALLSNYLGAS